MSKVLVAYATALGSTGEVAEAVGQALRSDGTDVDVRRAKEVSDVSGYDAVIVGSGVRVGHVYREALSFMEAHGVALGKVPVALFVVCITMQEDTEACRTEARSYVSQLEEKAPGLQPVDVGLFGGEVVYAKIPALLRFVLKRVIKQKEVDARDWDAIRAWAEGLRPALLGA